MLVASYIVYLYWRNRRKATIRRAQARAVMTTGERNKLRKVNSSSVAKGTPPIVEGKIPAMPQIESMPQGQNRPPSGETWERGVHRSVVGIDWEKVEAERRQGDNWRPIEQRLSGIDNAQEPKKYPLPSPNHYTLAPEIRADQSTPDELENEARLYRLAKALAF